jgi:hypothetical protein
MRHAVEPTQPLGAPLAAQVAHGALVPPRDDVRSPVAQGGCCGVEHRGGITAELHGERVGRSASVGVLEVGDSQLEEAGEDERIFLIGIVHAGGDARRVRVSHGRATIRR